MVTLILAKVIFKAMIVVVSLDADFAFINKIQTFAQNLALILGFPGLKAIIQPFADLIEYLVVFRLDFGFVNLTCEGSTSPMKLIVALFVMGVVIVIVQSNIALFKTITYDTLTEKVHRSRLRLALPHLGPFHLRKPRQGGGKAASRPPGQALRLPPAAQRLLQRHYRAPQQSADLPDHPPVPGLPG